MREPSTAEVLPVAVLVNGRTYFWTASAGLDPAVVESVDAWIRRCANRFATAALMRGLELDDLLQEGRAGALRAARSFDPSAGTTFLVYADSWIRQAMMAALSRSHAVYMPWRHRQQALKDGTLPGVLRLDAPVPDHEATYLDLQPCEQPTPLEIAEQAEARRTVGAALQRLSPLQRTVLIRRYGLDGPAASVQAIARELGCGRQRIILAQFRAEAQLRAFLRETSMGHLKSASPSAQSAPHGRQITIQTVIRDRKRQEHALAKAEKKRKQAARAATKGTPLFSEEV